MVERFGLFENIGGIGLRLEKDGEWVRHSDHLAIIGRIEEYRTDEHVQWMAELSALKKQVEELTKALNRKVDEKCAAVQARTRAEAEAAALRKALIEARAVVDAVTGHNQPDRPWSRQVRDRIDAALASTRETSE